MSIREEPSQTTFLKNLFFIENPNQLIKQKKPNIIEAMNNFWRLLNSDIGTPENRTHAKSNLIEINEIIVAIKQIHLAASQETQNIQPINLNASSTVNNY